MSAGSTFSGQGKCPEDLYNWVRHILEEQADTFEASMRARVQDFDDPDDIAALVAEARAAIDGRAADVVKHALTLCKRD